MKTAPLPLITAMLPLLLSGTPAIAQSEIHPDCVTQKFDLAGKRRCTCALETGGRINPNGRGWRYTRASAYDACMTQKGWIPG